MPHLLHQHSVYWPQRPSPLATDCSFLNHNIPPAKRATLPPRLFWGTTSVPPLKILFGELPLWEVTHKVIGPPLYILISSKCLIFKSLVKMTSTSLKVMVLRAQSGLTLCTPRLLCPWDCPTSLQTSQGQGCSLVCVCVCVCVCILSGLTSDSYKVDAYVYESVCGVYTAKQLLPS